MEDTAPTSDEGTLGAALRAARELHGLSVEDVSATTRIRGTVIRDLERDFLTSSGGTVYARGHVKAIASAIGVDAAPYLSLLSRQAPEGSGSAPAATFGRVPVEPLRVPTAAPRERRGPHWVAAGAVALALLIGLFVIGQLNRPSAGPSSSAAVQPVSSPPAASPAATATAVPSVRPSIVGAALRLRLRGGASWVSVRNPTRTLFEGVLPAGTVRDFQDPGQLRLVVGNAGAVSLVCSGHDFGAAGRQGAVRRFTCASDGIAPA